MKSACSSFTHPLTPSREGRGEHILKSFAIIYIGLAFSENKL
jgi:hypothetical protein